MWISLLIWSYDCIFGISDINECDDPSTNNCDPEDAECANTVGGYNCSCKANYTGNGVFCVGKSVVFSSFVLNQDLNLIRVCTIKIFMK